MENVVNVVLENNYTYVIQVIQYIIFVLVVRT